MKYCINCKQDVNPRRDMSGAKKIMVSITFVICISLGSLFFIGGSYSGNDGTGTFFFFIILSSVISMIVYYAEAPSCPMCKCDYWKKEYSILDKPRFREEFIDKNKLN